MIDDITAFTQTEINVLTQITKNGLFDLKDTFIRDFETVFISLQSEIDSVEENILSEETKDTIFLINEIREDLTSTRADISSHIDSSLASTSSQLSSHTDFGLASTISSLSSEMIPNLRN